MHTITYRQLQTNAEWMAHLPVAITRYGRVVAIISVPSDNVTVTNENLTVRLEPQPVSVTVTSTPASYDPCRVCGTKYIKHQGEAYEKYHKGLGDYHEFQA